MTVEYKDVEIDNDGVKQNAQEAIDEIDEVVELCYELLTCTEL